MDRPNPASEQVQPPGAPEQDETVEDINETEETIPSRYSITAYGADHLVDGLVRRLLSGDILIPTFDPETPSSAVEGFQRRFVWTKPQCDRFIDSLLLGFPVPGIFLAKQSDGRLLVLDGQQRLRTIHAFVTGILRGREFKLETVQERYRGLTYSTLDEEDRRRLNDSIIHATIVRQDQPTGDQSSIYLIFERLNTGGTTLHPQEIRVALFRGGLVRLLRDLNTWPAWRALYGKVSPRLKDQELILRFLALLYWRSEYQRPMKDFLNRYTEANRDFELQGAETLKGDFERTTTMILEAVGGRAFRLGNAVNAALLDSLMVAVAERLSSLGTQLDAANLRAAYETMVSNEEYLAAIERATADEENVKRRLRIALTLVGGA